jgi:hypothetical protein
MRQAPEQGGQRLDELIRAVDAAGAVMHQYDVAGPGSLQARRNRSAGAKWPPVARAQVPQHEVLARHGRFLDHARAQSAKRRAEMTRCYPADVGDCCGAVPHFAPCGGGRLHPRVPVAPGVIADLVAGRHDLAHQVGMPAGVRSHHEEYPPDIRCGQQVEYARRPAIVRAVVEGEPDTTGVRPAGGAVD